MASRPNQNRASSRPITPRRRTLAHDEKGRQALVKAREAKKKKAEERAANPAPEDEAETRIMGRPKPATGQTWMLDECIASALSHDDAVESRRIADAMLRQAAKGNVLAAAFLADRTQGKPVQKLKLEGGLTVGLMDELLADPPKEGE